MGISPARGEKEPIQRGGILIWSIWGVVAVPLVHIGGWWGELNEERKIKKSLKGCPPRQTWLGGGRGASPEASTESPEASLQGLGGTNPEASNTLKWKPCPPESDISDFCPDFFRTTHRRVWLIFGAPKEGGNPEATNMLKGKPWLMLILG